MRKARCRYRDHAHPWRLDFDWRWHQAVLEVGCMISIKSDAHSMPEPITCTGIRDGPQARLAIGPAYPGRTWDRAPLLPEVSRNLRYAAARDRRLRKPTAYIVGRPDIKGVAHASAVSCVVEGDGACKLKGNLEAKGRSLRPLQLRGNAAQQSRRGLFARQVSVTVTSGTPASGQGRISDIEPQ